MPTHARSLAQRTDIATPIQPRRSNAPRLRLAALLALVVAGAPHTALAAGVLSNASVTPASGTTADTFTFSVQYASTESPTRPAQSVTAEVAGITVNLAKISGAAHSGTWQGTATLPAGTWQVTFRATTSSDPQPEALLGPLVTVTGPPAPGPSAAPPPPAPSAPAPPTNPEPVPTPPPSGVTVPTSVPATQPPASGGSSSPSAAATGRSTESPDPMSAGVAPTEPAAPARMFASLLIVGGTMSIAGAAVLARQWYAARRPRSR